MVKKYRKSIFDQLESPPKNQKYIKFFEKIRWGGKLPPSLYDPASKVWKLANNWYKCKNTGKKFNVRTGTVLQYSNIPLRKWYLACCLFNSKKGVSSYQLAKYLNITFTTASILLKDLRSLLEQFKFVKEKLKNAQIDETLVGGSNPNRHWDKKIPNCQGRSCKGRTPILGMLGNYLITKVTSDTKLTTLEPIINKHVEAGATIYTDEWYRKSRLGKRYNHKMVNHSAKPKQFKNGEVTTNSIENVWSSHFKRTIKGTYHNNISDKYLQNYADEFTFRFNTRKWNEEKRLEFLLLTMMGKSLTYQEFSQI